MIYKNIVIIGVLLLIHVLRNQKLWCLRKGDQNLQTYFINNVKLNVVTSYKYLGIEFFKNGNWNRTQKRISEHASFALHKLYLILDKVSLPVNDMGKLFDSLVGSVLSYSAEVLGEIMKQQI